MQLEIPTPEPVMVRRQEPFTRVQVKRPLVKTSPYWSKRPQTRKKDWSKRPHKASPFFKGDFSKKYGIPTKKRLVLVSGTNVWKFEMMFWWGILCSCCFRSTLEHNSFLCVLMSAFLFQNDVFKGLFLEYHHNVQIIPRYVRSDLGIYKSLANVISIRHQHAKS